MTCAGEGSPTVVLEAGLDTSGDTFTALAVELAATTRVCYSDRAGVGASAPLADDAPDPWPGSSADALAAELARSGEPAPYVVLGWSYGGMVAQAFAARHPDVTAGLVLEDSSVPEQFVDPAWERFDVVDGGREVDLDSTVAELSEVDLADLPTVVLSSDELEGRLRTLWYRYHDRLAASSTDGVHVEARDSAHALHESSPEVVLDAVAAVVDAVRAASTLGDCATVFDAAGERCLRTPPEARRPAEALAPPATGGRPRDAVLVIPALGVSGLPVVAYRGTPDDAPGTAIQDRGSAASPHGSDGLVGPGGIGNYLVTGHRSSSTAPFRHLPSLRLGARVVVVTAAHRLVYEVVRNQRTSFRSLASLRAQSAAVPGRPGREATRAMITLSTCATYEDHAVGNYWSDRFHNPEHRIEKIGVLRSVRRR
jgi:sortase A